MKLAQFITENMGGIIAEWEVFARTLSPAADTMTPLALQNHVQRILEAVAHDIETAQTNQQQSDKAKGRKAFRLGAPESAAAAHGALRHLAGFELGQLAAE